MEFLAGVNFDTVLQIILEQKIIAVENSLNIEIQNVFTELGEEFVQEFRLPVEKGRNRF